MRKFKAFAQILSFSLLFSIIASPLPVSVQAQTAPQQVSSDAAAIDRIKAKLEARQKELGIPGLSLAIVKDGQVILAEGFGFRDLEKKVPVTADTQFAIGSATKAFTALSVLMSADDGLVDLDASPRKYLTYFKMFDPETDRTMTVRDLLTHSSGLNRTDLAMLTGKLSRRELIEVAGQAKPMAKLREKFFYQNIMYAAAGEVAAGVNKTTYEKYVPERIFKPLGMSNSTMSIDDMKKARDYSFGYEYNFDNKETKRLPFRPIDDVSPAGSINSSANDMTKWLRFVLAGGVVDGKRLVTEKSFAEWLKPQMKVTPNGSMSYGLGWFIQDWNGHKVVQHGGNIDGFNSMVAMIPEKKIGFVLLTNVTGSPLGNDMMSVVWSNLLGEPAKPTVVAAAPGGIEKEVGKYNFVEAGFDIDVKIENGKLIAIAPGQPTFTLENVGGRRYKVVGAPDGFFMNFKDDSVYIEQPQGNYTLPKAGAVKPTETGSARDLVGKFGLAGKPAAIEIKSETDGRVTLNVTGQQPYTLREKTKDQFAMDPLPDSYSVRAKRTDGKVTSIVITQPEGEFEFVPVTSDQKPAITADELMAKSIAAVGGEANWRKFTTRIVEAELDFVNQGVKATTVGYAKAPNKTLTRTTMTALGKIIGTGVEYFDGTNGGDDFSFSPTQTFSGKRLDDARRDAEFYAPLDWKKIYKTAEIKGSEKVGTEDCWVVELTPEKGTKVIELYSKSSYLLLQRRGTIPSSTGQSQLPYTLTYSDYREIDGIKIPFKTVNDTPSMGEVVSIVTKVRHNEPIDDRIFVERKRD